MENIMKKLIYNILTCITVLSAWVLYTSDRKILLIPLDVDQELRFNSKAKAFEDEKYAAIHNDCIQGLVAQNCALLVPHHIIQNILLQSEIVNNIVNKNYSKEDFQKKFGHFPQFASSKTTATYYSYFKQIAGIVHELKNTSDFATTIQTFSQKISDDEQSILNPYNKHYKALKSYIIAYAAHFNPQDWYIQDVSKTFYLLIPKKLLQDLRDKNKIPQCPHLTEQDDQLLSLPASTLDTIQPSELLQTSLTHVRSAKNDMPTNLHSFIQSFSKNHLDANSWTIILCGHGCSSDEESEGAVASMTYDQFRTLCMLLNTHSTIKRLIVSSCESGGINAFSLFKNPQTHESLSLNYDSITVGIANALQFGQTDSIFPLKDCPFFTPSINVIAYKSSAFNTLATLKSPQGKNKDVIINTLFPYWQNNRLEANNLILYREKNSTQTIPLELEGIIHRLSKTILEDDSICAIDLSLQSLPQAIVIETPCINKTVTVPTEYKKFPKCISFINYHNPYHYIKEIKAPGCSLDTILTAFFAVERPAFSHVWEVDRIESSDGIFTSVLIGQNILKNESRLNYVLYKQSQKHYIAHRKVKDNKFSTKEVLIRTFINQKKNTVSPIEDQRNAVLKSLKTRASTSQKPDAKRQKN